MTVTVRYPLLPEFVDANTATGQLVVERDRYVDGWQHTVDGRADVVSSPSTWSTASPCADPPTAQVACAVGTALDLPLPGEAGQTHRHRA